MSTVLGETAGRIVTEPGPRAGLDEGTVHDLWVDASQVVLPVLPARPLHATAEDGEPLVVPAAAAALVDELPTYGS